MKYFWIIGLHGEGPDEYDVSKWDYQVLKDGVLRMACRGESVVLYSPSFWKKIERIERS